MAGTDDCHCGLFVISEKNLMFAWLRVFFWIKNIAVDVISL